MLLNNNKIGVLLLNLGTPDSPTVRDVGKYLKQFLQDPRVIELPAVLRWILVRIFIVPFRSYKSAAAYAKIWQQSGSPLLTNTKHLKAKLAITLGDNYEVALGMRYGKPSIRHALQQLEQAQVQKIIVMPLFPQYSSAATGSALQQVLQIVSKYRVIPELEVKQAYFKDPKFIQALAESLKPFITDDFDYLLMSYHGLPEQQITGLQKQDCYRAQCYQTSSLLAQNLKITDSKWGVGFQSRLGRLPWIKPYTDELLVTLRQQGLKKLVVCCPSFVVDCLETLEEIGIRAREQWLLLGGESLQLVPCLNDQLMWVEALADNIRGVR